MAPILFHGCVIAALLHDASAAEVSLVRPTLPAYSPTGDDGAATVWSNPANLAFDPDPGFALLYSQGLTDVEYGGFAAAANTGPLAVGLQYRGDVAGDPWWTISTGLAFRLERDLALGVHLGWQLPGGPDNNFRTWDLGLGYRPLPWLGLSARAQNLGEVQDGFGVTRRLGVGTALRPWGDRVLLGIDYSVASNSSIGNGLAGATLRVQPIRGLTLRASADTDGEFGAGVEVYFGGPGVGVFAGTVGAGGDPAALAYLVSGDSDRRIFGGDKQVPVFSFGASLPYQSAAGIFGGQQESYLHLLERLRKAGEDPGVRGLVLHLDNMPLSMAQVQEVRGLIKAARAEGKVIVAYMDRATSNGAYVLASACDRIYLHPAAQVDLVGLSAEQLYFREALNLVGVEPQVIRRAEYKSAYESYTNSESSPANREQMNALLDDIYSQMIDAVAEGRGRKPEDVAALIDKGPFTADEAIEAGLIDRTMYPDELEGALEELYPKGFHLDDEYALDDGTNGWRSPWEVAVVYVDGVINSGSSGAPGLLSRGRSAGSDTIVRQLRQAMDDDSVKAVVLRVDSPGGSAFASDEIWRAVERVKREKPVVVSMGGVAASGGYYVSAPATAIYAEPATITGSIGVISAKVSLEKLYDKVGINYEEYRRGRHAGMYSLSRTFDDEELATLEHLIGDTYSQFKQKVVDGRHLTPEQVEEVARGRVWSGQAGVKNGLVDNIGGFHDALARARKEADIPERAEVELITYEDRGEGFRPAREAVRAIVPKRVATSLAEAGVGGGRADGLGAPALDLLPPELVNLLNLSLLADDHVWALMPYQLDLR